MTLSGLHAAIHVPGVQRVELIEPSSDLDISQQEASYCLSIELINKGTAV
ncbi:hypothetical protein [Veronia nyctiphanis]|nr:hypothetical protein [Veronia nyctiphanis]